MHRRPARRSGPTCLFGQGLTTPPSLPQQPGQVRGPVQAQVRVPRLELEGARVPGRLRPEPRHRRSARGRPRRTCTRRQAERARHAAARTVPTEDTAPETDGGGVSDVTCEEPTKQECDREDECAPDMNNPLCDGVSGFLRHAGDYAPKKKRAATDVAALLGVPALALWSVSAGLSLSHYRERSGSSDQPRVALRIKHHACQPRESPVPCHSLDKLSIKAETTITTGRLR